MIDLRILRWLASRGGRARGRGSLWTVLVLVCQLLVALSAFRPAEPPPKRDLRRSVAAQIVVQPPLGSDPDSLDAREAWPVNSRLQLTFKAEQEGWTSALWISGDQLVPLYPTAALRQTGDTGTAPYVVPGPGQWLRLTETAPEGDLIALVNAWGPVAEVERAVAQPTPANVRALRRWLKDRSGHRAIAAESEHFLPTQDGRAIPVRWESTAGEGALVRAWTVRAQSE